MLVLNFSHPLTAAHQAQLEALTGDPVDDVIEVKTQFDDDAPFEPQLTTLLDQIPLTSEQWQTASILINPPAYNYVATLLLAELHGRMGYFPAILRVRPVQGSIPSRYEVAEVINLQAVRDAARRRR